MRKLMLIPIAISSVRIAALPFFLYLYNASNVAACLSLLAFCAASDFSDGYLARKINVTSRFGAYYDAATDFILMIGIFSIFYAYGYYPFWLLILIAASFVQFVATSYYTKKLYDPIGKYLGSALYIGVTLTLLWPNQAVFFFVQYAFAGFFTVSIASRIVSLTRKQAKSTLN
jgi:phosphatidylglycerophosphate synthase